VVKNEASENEQFGRGQFTEKRVDLASCVLGWMRPYISKIFYVEEKGWNYYPYTITGLLSSKILNYNMYKILQSEWK